MTTQPQAVPNHHADYPGFAGITGLLAATGMAIGRQGDARLAERLSRLHAGDSVIDVGCGPGTAVRRAARLGASVIGVDPAPVMLRVARILTRSSGTVRYATGTAEALPLPDHSVSVLWTIASVHHWADLDAALSEAARVLRPEGRLIAIERRTRPDALGHGSHGWTDEQATAFAALCQQHGFIDTEVGCHQTGRRRTLSVTASAPAVADPGSRST
jgi:ubiquinone/menaquinone biosynthesis C-methylase UbiE